jgi:hypothetical protein
MESEDEYVSLACAFLLGPSEFWGKKRGVLKGAKIGPGIVGYLRGVGRRIVV